MADLRRADRGQILLVTAFALAVAFVGLALVLNSVIYTENLATRSESTTTSDAVTHAQSVEAGTRDIVAFINRYNTSGGPSYSTLEAELVEGIRAYSFELTRQELADGQLTNESLDQMHRGTQLVQTDRTREFTTEYGATEWTLVNDSANGAHSLRLFVDPDPGETLNLTAFDGDGDTWTLEVDSSDVRYTEADGTTRTCSSWGGTGWVNVSAGTVDNATCSGLDFGRDLDTIQKIGIENGDAAEGTYSLVVNKLAGGVDDRLSVPNDYGSEPSKRKAVFGADVRVVYERRTLTWRSTVRAIPGETDD